jgi:hypothetical protein
MHRFGLIGRRETATPSIDTSGKELTGRPDAVIPMLPAGLIFMTDTESQILQELNGLNTALATITTTDPKPDLVSLFHRIDTLTSQLPRNADPELLHFLHKKSYEKARLLLEGRRHENARGTCRS